MIPPSFPKNAKHSRTAARLPAGGRAQQGRVLLVLAFVIAIVFAAIAMPQYRYARISNQIARVVTEGSEQHGTVEACIAKGRRRSGVADDACRGTAAGSPFLENSGNTQYGSRPSDPTLGVPFLAFREDGTVTLTSTFGNLAAEALSSQKIIWTRDRIGTWTCASTVPKKHHHPARCPSIAPD
ncbi:pilin [Variovorax paradoxus]|uniref:pilin n=1 Tax=Variovorax paradoxus TaxID=34073 RepID=UPI003D654D5D